MKIGLWVVQVLLAFAFGMAGANKAFNSWDKVNEMIPWTTATGEPLTRFIGSMELLAAIGLLLPSLTRIKPKLTPLAAAGLVTIMTLAIPFHLSRGEYPGIALNLVLGGLAAFVAWGRYKKVPIE
jgi:putative oxidoreductase